MIKAVFFDIDGTLLSHTLGGVPPSAQEAISQLRQRNIKLFLATGRHILEIHRLPVGKFSFDGYVTLNGQILLNGQGEITGSFPVDPQDTAKLIAIFRQMEVPVQVVERGRMYLNFVNEQVRFAQKAISTPVPETGSYTGAEVYQFNIYDSGRIVNPLMAELPSCKMSRWNPYAVDIIPKTGGKVAGIRKVLEQWGIAPEEIMAFGDGENDMDMLRFAGVGVAMGNAPDSVKACADYVTGGVDSGGIFSALQRCGLLS